MSLRSDETPTKRSDAIVPSAWRAAVLLLIALLFALRVPLLKHREFDPDEFEHLHASYCVHEGMLPYRDFFENHAPWLHFALSGLYAIRAPSIDTLFVARALMLAVTGLILYLTYRLGRELYGAEVGLLGVLLLSCLKIFVDKTLEVRPDVPALACWLAGLIAVVRGIREDSPRLLGIAGLAMGAALLFTPKIVFGLAGVAAALAWVHIDYRFARPGGSRLRGTLLFLAGLALPIAATVAYFWARGGLDEFIKCNVLLSAGWQRQFWPYETLRKVIRQSPELAVLGLAGWVVSLIALFRWEAVRRGAAVPAMAALTLLIGQYVVPVPYRQYYQPLLPLWALFTAALLWRSSEMPPLSELRARWSDPPARTRILVVAIGLALVACGLWSSLRFSRPALAGSDIRTAWMWAAIGGGLLALGLPRAWQRGTALAFIAACAFALTPLRSLGAVFLAPAAGASALALVTERRRSALLLMVLGLVAMPVQQMRGALENRNDSQLAGIRFVLEHTSPDDKIFTGWSGMGVFRPHAYYYYFLHPEMRSWMSIQEQTDGPLRALETERPRLIEYDRHVRALPTPVQDYIRANYAPTQLDYIWMRKPPG